MKWKTLKEDQINAVFALKYLGIKTIILGQIWSELINSFPTGGNFHCLLITFAKV